MNKKTTPLTRIVGRLKRQHKKRLATLDDKHVPTLSDNDVRVCLEQIEREAAAFKAEHGINPAWRISAVFSHGVKDTYALQAKAVRRHFEVFTGESVALLISEAGAIYFKVIQECLNAYFSQGTVTAARQYRTSKSKAAKAKAEKNKPEIDAKHAYIISRFDKLRAAYPDKKKHSDRWIARKILTQDKKKITETNIKGITNIVGKR